MYEKDAENLRKQIELLIKWNEEHKEDIEEVRKNVKTIAEVYRMICEV